MNEAGVVALVTKPDYCCAEDCGRPTQSHNVAVDVSEHDAVGLPTLAGVVCHRCWTATVESATGNRAEMLEVLDTDEMVAVPAPVSELRGDSG